MEKRAAGLWAVEKGRVSFRPWRRRLRGERGGAGGVDNAREEVESLGALLSKKEGVPGTLGPQKDVCSREESGRGKKSLDRCRRRGGNRVGKATAPSKVAARGIPDGTRSFFL